MLHLRLISKGALSSPACRAAARRVYPSRMSGAIDRIPPQWRRWPSRGGRGAGRLSPTALVLSGEESIQHRGANHRNQHK